MTTASGDRLNIHT